MPDQVARIDDPTVLTTAQLHREVEAIRELQAKDREITETRLSAMDKAVSLLQEYPTEVDKAIASLKEVLIERFTRVEQVIDLKVDGVSQTVDLKFSDVQTQLDKGLTAQDKSTALALDAVNKAAQISQQTADRAVAKAEAAAEKVLLQSMISAVERNFEGQIGAVRESLQAAMASQEKAVTKAENATEKRFEGVNEFRAQLSDQASRFMPRQEAEAWSRASGEKITMLASTIDKMEGRSSGFSTMWGLIAGGIVIAIGLFGVVMALIGNA